MHDHTPEAKKWRERIGDRELELEEVRLDVFDQVRLWANNPRLMPFLDGGGVHSDEQLERNLEASRGYDVLHRHIRENGQMDPVYVWRESPHSKFLVLEGATRVTILRDLTRKAEGTPDADRHRYVRAKLLPTDFTEEERVILLARIHVRGTGVRSWGRYVEAKFVHDSVTPQNGGAPTMNVSQLAGFMGKSLSWVTRLKDAYTFASKFVEHLDSPDADRLALEHFSTLEEISKSTGFGPIVRDYGNPESDKLRAEVFDMVSHGVFKEYRDARFMKQFHDDPEKWAQLQTHEQNIANKLAAEESKGGSGLAARIRALPAQVERALDRDPSALDASAIDHLDRAARSIETKVAGAPVFRNRLHTFSEALSNVTLKEIRDVPQDEYDELTEALDDFKGRLQKHADWGANL